VERQLGRTYTSEATWARNPPTRFSRDIYWSGQIQSHLVIDLPVGRCPHDAEICAELDTPDIPLGVWNISIGSRAIFRYLEPIPGRSGFFAVLFPQADQQIERQTARGGLDVPNGTGNIHL
jgi:hypothetical protein